MGNIIIFKDPTVRLFEMFYGTFDIFIKTEVNNDFTGTTYSVNIDTKLKTIIYTAFYYLNM